MKKVILLLTVIAFSSASFDAAPQEFKPYPRANISPAQWQTYFDEVRHKHGASVQDIEAQRLLVYIDSVTGTIYGFTKPGHPAHPAWVSRKPEQRGDSIFMAQIGYFAGEEAPFAKLFREYQELNERMNEELARRQSQASPAGGRAAVSAEVPHSLSAGNQDKQWQPSIEQRKRVLSDVLDYLAAKDKRSFSEAYAKFTASQKAAVPFDKWEADMRAFYGDAGAAEGRTLQRVTWYKNPANAPPGVYAAVNFVSQFSELSLHCGFVAMQLQMDGTFAVTREEENSISKREMVKLSPERLQQVRAQYRC